MKLARPQKKRPQEGTIALINVVFLMLIFFLIAGTIAPPLDKEISLVETKIEEGVPPPDALALRKDGGLFFRGEATTVADFLEKNTADKEVVRIVVDQKLPASKLIDVISQLKSASAKPIRIVTRKSLK